MNWRKGCLDIPVRYFHGAGVSIFCVAIFLSACQGTKRPHSGETSSEKFYAVGSDSAKFFRYGPQQGNGPDLTLQKDTLVKLIRPSFGYCKIQLVKSGEQGYVAREDIHVAPPALIAAVNGTANAQSASHSSEEQFKLNSSDPRLVVPPEQLPDPDLPPPAPDPSQASTPHL